MFNEKLLWKERLNKSAREYARYLRYIFNGHMLIALLFLVGTGAYYYQQWVKGLPDAFPTAFVMAVIVAAFVTYSPIYTFLLEADRVFLLPLEEQLAPYFRKALIFSFFMQLYFLVISLAVVMPLYAQRHHGDYRNFILFLLLILFAKAINLLIRWDILRFVEVSVHRIDTVIRFLLNGVFLYLLFSDAAFFFLLIVAVIYIGVFLIFHNQVKGKGLKWELLIAFEERRMMAFYRLANLFTDVPQLRNRVKRRKWLDGMLSFLPFDQRQTFMNLYFRSFLRSGDYFGLFLRLIIIGGVVLYFIIQGIGQIIFVLLLLYLTGVQLLPLWNQHQYKLWLQLYPLKNALKQKSFQQLLFRLLICELLLLTIAILVKGDIQNGLLTVIIGSIFAFGFVYIYCNKRLTGQ
ncbi:ABC transporter permease [Bacillaceae bacterium Marseille-Q3522]|nr:ABC transporter permease [Bacillaceae bacterium Marseille-Q3522]